MPLKTHPASRKFRKAVFRNAILRNVFFRNVKYGNAIFRTMPSSEKENYHKSHLQEKTPLYKMQSSEKRHL
jgi:hypothetical protein